MSWNIQGADLGSLAQMLGTGGGYQQQAQPSYANTINSNLLGGIGAMQGLGSAISNGFGQANAQSGYNMAAQVPYEVEQARQAGMTNRLNAMLPVFSGLLGRGGGAGMQGFSTNFGQGASLPQAAAPAPAAPPATWHGTAKGQSPIAGAPASLGVGWY